MWWFYAHFLARKHKSNIKAVLTQAEENGNTKVIRKGNDRRRTFIIRIGKREQFLDLFPPKTAEIKVVTNKETWTEDLQPVNPQNWLQGRSAVTRLTAITRSEGICEHCGENPAMQVHHRNRMATKRTTLAKVASDKGQREQAQALCRACHLEVHHGTFNG